MCSSVYLSIAPALSLYVCIVERESVCVTITPMLLIVFFGDVCRCARFPSQDAAGLESTTFPTAVLGQACPCAQMENIIGQQQ